MPKDKNVPAPAVEAEEDYTTYADKAATDLQSRMATWVKEKTGKTFATKKEEAAFDEGIRLGVALRMKFQASPENQAVLTSKASAPKAEKVAPAGDAAPKGKKAAKAAAVPAPAEPVEEKAAKSKAAKPAKAAAGAGKKAPF